MIIHDDFLVYISLFFKVLYLCIRIYRVQIHMFMTNSIYARFLNQIHIPVHNFEFSLKDV